MVLAVWVFITWTIIIVFLVIPKELSELDMVFMYFANTVFVISTFTLFDLNLKYIMASHAVEKSFSVLIYRIIAIPLLLIISSNVLMYPWKWLKWGIVVGMIALLVLLQELLKWTGVVTFQRWNVFYSVLTFSCFIVFSRVMAWLIVHADGKEVQES